MYADTLLYICIIIHGHPLLYLDIFRIRFWLVASYINAYNARGGVISIAIHEPTNLLYGVNGQGSLYKIPLRSSAEIEAPDIFDFLIIPLSSVLSGGLGDGISVKKSDIFRVDVVEFETSYFLKFFLHGETGKHLPASLISYHPLISIFEAS